MHIPKFMWENIAMDFTMDLSVTLGHHNTIWVIVDRLTKSTQFILVMMNYNSKELVVIYTKKVLMFHRVIGFIIFDRAM